MRRLEPTVARLTPSICVVTSPILHAGGSEQPIPDDVYTIPYVWILSAGAFGSLVLLLFVTDWCGWNSL